MRFPSMHWADVLAGELLERGSHHVLAMAITPSGPIHVGNMREVLTADAVHRAVKDQGGTAELVYIGDTYDPLRKVYPFLDADAYAEEVGKPLSEIPCPCGDHASYAEHFLLPLLDDFRELGIEPRVLLAHEMYEEGAYVEATKRALDEAATIKGILEEVSDRMLPETWFPFNVRCQACGRISDTEVRLYEYPKLEYVCHQCGFMGEVDVEDPGIGKLPWRVDWPARWDFLDVTFEAFGKDHAASGGSWDTGVEIARRVYDREPPHHAVYEHIMLKGVGAMHSSTGTTVSATDMLRMTPPEALRFLIMKQQPNRHIDFDPGLGVLNLVDEYDRWEDAYFAGDATPDMKELERTYELSQPRGVPDHVPPRVGYRHLVTLVQIAHDPRDAVVILQRNGDVPPEASEADVAHLVRRLEHARFWLGRFAPDDVKFELQREPPQEVLAGLDEAERSFARAYGDALEALPRWEAEAIHEAVYGAAEAAGLKVGRAFRTIYRVFLARDRGPRAGFFLASQDRAFVVGRLQLAGRGD